MILQNSSQTSCNEVPSSCLLSFKRFFALNLFFSFYSGLSDSEPVPRPDMKLFAILMIPFPKRVLKCFKTMLGPKTVQRPSLARTKVYRKRFLSNFITYMSIFPIIQEKWLLPGFSITPIVWASVSPIERLMAKPGASLPLK